jgi:AcrR family transcriptional regulator
MTDTKERILDAAERLFSHDGFEATSLRAITAEAHVNLAAVNYHFQSKEALVRAVIGRRLGPVNERRIALLDDCEAAAGDGPLPLEPVLDAFIRPVLEIAQTHAKEFGPLMGRLYTEPGEFIKHVYKEHLEQVGARFVAAFERALPDLPPVDLMWRLHFVIGVMTHTLGAARLLEFLSHGRCDPSDVEGTLQRIKTFVAAGLATPASSPVSGNEVQHAIH